jgi:peptidoglycan/LPS O-acetylase OafA/YrhL
VRPQRSQRAGRSKRILQLDVLRTVAVVLVIGRHVPFGSDAHPCLLAWQRGGWIGVDLFFVLSGFLVSGLLFREYAASGTIDVRRFLIRRGLKIYPAFYAFLLLTLVPFMVWEAVPGAAEIAGEVLFLQNSLGRVWDHTWSLAVEEQFYIGIALCVSMLIGPKVERGQLSKLPKILVGIAGGVLLLRVVNADAGWKANSFPTLMRIDSLGFGVLLAYGWQFHQERMASFFRRYGFVATVLGMVTLSVVFAYPLETTPAITTWGFTAFYVSSGVILMSLLVHGVTENRLTRVVAALGARSYSVYLWHLPVILWLTPAVMRWSGSASGWLMVGVSVAGSMIVGVAMSWFVEFPVLLLRERYFPSKTAGLTTTAAADPGVAQPLPELATASSS